MQNTEIRPYLVCNHHKYKWSLDGPYLPFFHKFSPPMWDEYPHMSNTFGEVQFIENNP